MKTNILKSIAILLTITLVNAGCSKKDKVAENPKNSEVEKTTKSEDEDDNAIKFPCKDMVILKVFNNEKATVKKGTFSICLYDGLTTDKFYFELVNQDYDFIYNFPGIVPVEEIPEQYRKEGLSVYISGNVTNCVIGGGTSYTGARLAPIFLFELKSIKIRN